MSAQRLINAVTFFGDSAIPETDQIYKSVYDAAQLLAQNKYAIVNGGGPGVMQAATSGAESVNGHTVAVYWEPKLAAYFEGKNIANITDEAEASPNYLLRTLGLIEKGDAYVVCKGGSGTISELGMVWALAKLYYGAHKPVILFGDFWDELIAAFQRSMNIDEIELGVLYQARTAAEILALLEEHEGKVKHSLIRPITSEERAFLITGRLRATQPSTISEMVAKEAAGELMPQAGETGFKRQQDSIASDYHFTHAGKLVSQVQLDEFISLVHPPAKVLDVGVGPGYDANYLAERFSVTGIEISRRFVEIAKYENPELEIYQGDIVDFPLPENAYKGIWTRDCLHHIEGKHLPGVFKKLASSLVAGGVLYIIVREGQGEVVEKDHRYGRNIEKFFHLFSAEELMQLAEGAGFQLVKLDRTKRSHDWLIAAFRKLDNRA